MQCDRAQEFFSDYLERTLDRPMTVALEAHLAGCAGCRGEIEGLQDTFLALDEVPEVEPPADGAWRVMMRLRQEQAERYENERGRTPGVLQWLRSLNPLSVGMGFSLATLVIGGMLVVSGIAPHVQDIFFPVPKIQARVAPAAPLAPAVTAYYGSANGGQQVVTVQVTPPPEMRDLQVQVSLGGPPVVYSVHAIPSGTPLPFPISLPISAGVQSLRVTVQAGGKQYQDLVVVPLGRRNPDPVRLVFSDESLEEGLRRLAPYLGQPIVVDGAVNRSVAVTLDAQDRQPASCLQELASRVGATVQRDEGAYRLVPQP
jgi:hypothetical protein